MDVTPLPVRAPDVCGRTAPSEQLCAGRAGQGCAAGSVCGCQIGRRGFCESSVGGGVGGGGLDWGFVAGGACEIELAVRRYLARYYMVPDSMGWFCSS